RDCRINRIYEGTNEINRMIIPGTLMRRAMKGQLPLMDALQKLTPEIMAFDPKAVKLGEGPLAVQQQMIKMCKKIGLMTAGLAAMKFMDKLANEQETMGYISDIMIETFAMESGCLRALKSVSVFGLEKSKYQIDAVKLYVNDALPKIEALAKKVLAYVAEGDALTTQLAGLRKLTFYTPINTVALTRGLADRIIELERYPLTLS
ncbi:MAG: acyl-CoA dehydrogenase, partial [Deltaproteobacteria bacterium]|nr:acyl-CoA dehydrogenase [Deltaproteobacteria bacterium]